MCPWRGRRSDADFADEIRANIAIETDRLIASGMTPGDARAAARRTFGNVTRAQERFYESRRLLSMDALQRDLRLAFRSIRRAPGFAATVVLTFALGIGATSAVFVVVSSVLLRPLPYPNATRLVKIEQTLSQAGTVATPADPVSVTANLAPNQFSALRAGTSTISALAAYATPAMTWSNGSRARRINVGEVSVGFFEAFGVAPIIGRTFHKEDESPAGSMGVSAIMSYRTWNADFGRDASVVGRTVTLNGRAFPVVGVMPDGFSVPEVGVAAIDRTPEGSLDDGLAFWVAWTPPSPASSPGPGFSMFPVVAALANGIDSHRATDEVRALLPPLPNGRRPLRVQVAPLLDDMVRDVRPTLLIFQGSVVLVLLIAAANVANLLLARASHRHQELAVRLALGASRFQAAREWIAECFVLATAGSLIGIGLTAGAVSALRTLPPGLIPRLTEVELRSSTILFALALSFVASALVALFVSARLLRDGSWSGLRPAPLALKTKSKPSAALVMLQVAAAVTLLAGAALLLNSFVRLSNQPFGFTPRDLLSVRLSLPAGRYRTNQEQADFYDRVVQELAGIPGVESVAMASGLPYEPGRVDFFPISIAGETRDPGTTRPVTRMAVSPGYFRTAGVQLLEGREFDETDRTGALPTVIVSKAFADRYSAGKELVGEEVTVANAPPARVVGVVADTASRSMRPGTSSLFPAVYFSTNQPPEPTPNWSLPSMTALIRTQSAATTIVPAARSRLAALDPMLTVYGAAPVDQLLSERFAETRLYSDAAVAFAIVAVLLAAIGLYGVLAYSVGSRTHEIGIRLALGADGSRVLRDVMTTGLRLTLAGVAIGAGGAWFTNRSLERLLFGVQPHDISSLAAVALFCTLVAMVACYVPARRAARVDPLVALRCE